MNMHLRNNLKHLKMVSATYCKAISEISNDCRKEVVSEGVLTISELFLLSLKRRQAGHEKRGLDIN